VKRTLPILVAAVATAGSAPASAYTCDGCVVSAVQVAQTTITTAITSSVNGLSATLRTSLDAINTNLSNVGSKVADAVVQTGNQQREMNVEVQRRAEKERVERETELPIDPCSNSGTNYAGQAQSATGSKSSSYKRGGGGANVSSPVLAKALNDPIPSPEATRRQTHAIHTSKYCSSLEARLGYPGCNSSSMPDADANIESILTGAGMPGKDSELSFTSDQEEAARAYSRLSIDPHPPQNITKTEAGTEQGKLYVALQKMYQANISGAERVQFDAIASRVPFPGSAKYVSDIKQSDDAAKYFNATASKQAKSGNMSWAEMAEFEAGRRSRNPYWAATVATATPEQIQREQAMMQALAIDLQYQSLRQLEKLSINIGLLLASETRKELRPAIEAQLLRVQSTNAR